MTATNFTAALDAVLEQEGGWSDNPDDPGGATMKGVTLATFQSYYPGATVDDLRNITDAQLQVIYRSGYWNRVSGDSLPNGIDLTCFDIAVNSGPRRAAQMLQDALHIPSDGIIGPQTLSAASGADSASIVAAIANLRAAYYESLDTFDEFGRGWLARVDAIKAASLALIGT